MLLMKQSILEEMKMTLSDKISLVDFESNVYDEECVSVIQTEDIKEFLKKLKKAFPINCIENHRFNNKIDELAGVELVE